MFLDIDLLFTWGAIAKEYEKNEIIFEAGEHANFYYQLIEGSVKMFNLNEEGKEFTQGVFFDGQSFGEPPLFVDDFYPSTAQTCTSSKIIKLSKDKFLKILEEYPSYQKKFLNLMAQRNLAKAKTSRDIINQSPKHRIICFLESKKDENSIEKKLVPYTRQEIANFTGLRVETVIRELSKMKKNKIVDIIDHKLYY